VRHSGVLRHPHGGLWPAGGCQKVISLLLCPLWGLSACAQAASSHPSRFLRIMEVATRSGFLSVPCKLDWNEKANKWTWDAPAWFQEMGYYTLGTYVAHKLEQVTAHPRWIEVGKETIRPSIHADSTESFHSFLLFPLLAGHLEELLAGTENRPEEEPYPTAHERQRRHTRETVQCLAQHARSALQAAPHQLLGQYQF